MIMRLGKIVFEKVCQMISEKDPHRYGLRYIEVNLSAIQCSYDKLADEFIEIMKKYNVPPEYINFEITESASLNAKRTLLKNMKQLIDYGVSFSLDDFGTGYNSEYALITLHPNIVKIDRSIISGCDRDISRRTIISSIVNLARTKNIRVLAEGVETEGELRTVIENGVDLLQGYFINRPVFEPQPIPKEVIDKIIEYNK